MLLPLPDLDVHSLTSMLNRRFNVSSETVEFVPLGADSWHYRVGDLWASVRRDLRGHVPEAYMAAMLLARSGLDFVLAPLAADDGRVSHWVGGHPVVVFPYLPVTEVKTPSDADVRAIVGALERVHEASVPVPLPSETFDLPFGADLFRALDVARRGAPDTGPYSRLLQNLIRSHRGQIESMYAEFQDLSSKCAAADTPFALTHGEPGAGNVLRRADRIVLADWGELMWGPVERDWYHLARSFGSAPLGRPEFLRFYEIRWYFNEFTEYAARFFNPHRGDVEDAMMWDNLLACLEGR